MFKYSRNKKGCFNNRCKSGNDLYLKLNQAFRKTRKSTKNIFSVVNAICYGIPEILKSTENWNNFRYEVKNHYSNKFVAPRH